jgi:hypothetical protein
MFRHATERYKPLLREREERRELLLLEHAKFGVSHDTLGAALCEAGGWRAPAVDSVRYHVIVNSTLELPMHVPRRAICAISALAHALMTDPDHARLTSTRKVAPQAELEPAARGEGARGCRSRSRWRSNGRRSD